MTTNKLPPLPESIASLRGLAEVIRKHGICAPLALETVANNIEQALRQSQSLPAGAASEVRRVIHELRTYNPAADEYKGQHIHGVWARELEAALQADAREKGEAVVPDGWALVPDYRGYANLGIGAYILGHSAETEDAELFVSIATEAEKVGRTVGDLRDCEPGVIQPEQMAVRLRFENVAGLDALEQQLRILRSVHFPATQPAQASEKGDAAVLGHMFPDDLEAFRRGDCPQSIYSRPSESRCNITGRVSHTIPVYTHPQPVTPAGGEVDDVAVHPIDHAKALSLAIRRQTSSNLARCYVDIVVNEAAKIDPAHPSVADAALAGDAELGRYIRLTAEQRNHGLSPPAFWLRVEQAIERRAALNQRGGGK